MHLTSADADITISKASYIEEQYFNPTCRIHVFLYTTWHCTNCENQDSSCTPGLHCLQPEEIENEFIFQIFCFKLCVSTWTYLGILRSIFDRLSSSKKDLIENILFTKNSQELTIEGAKEENWDDYKMMNHVEGSNISYHFLKHTDNINIDILSILCRVVGL